MPHPYLLQVYSQPRKVAPEIWIQWYLEEHIRDMVYFGVVKTAGFYQATSDAIIHSNPPADANDERTFLAMFQTASPNALSNPQFREKVRQTTELWGGKRGREVGELSDSESELVEVFGTSDDPESAASHFIQCSITGGAVTDELQSEFINPVSALDEYVRTLSYRKPGSSPDEAHQILLLHEFDSLDSNQLPLVQEVMEGAAQRMDCAFRLRAYKLLGSEGFDGECRVPARL